MNRPAIFLLLLVPAGCGRAVDANGEGCPAKPAAGQLCSTKAQICHYGCDSMDNTCECGDSVWSCYHTEWCLQPDQPDASPDTSSPTTTCSETCITHFSGDAATPAQLDAGYHAPPTPICEPIEPECNGDPVCACELRCPWGSSCPAGQCDFKCYGM